MIKHMQMVNFKSYYGVQDVGPFHKVRRWLKIGSKTLDNVLSASQLTVLGSTTTTTILASATHSPRLISVPLIVACIVLLVRGRTER